MPKRGEVNNRDFATQIRDFSGLLFGTITPTDIDGLIDFHNKLFVLMEFKYKDTPLPRGQQLAIERLVDLIFASGKLGIGIIAYHSTDGDIDCALCTVREYRWKKRWHLPTKPITVREVIDRMLLKHKGVL